MNREEFLEILCTQLEGTLPSNEIAQHLAYYNDFINRKIRQGEPEENVLNELGDPRLIAKTLIDTEDVPNRSDYQQSYDYSAEETGHDSFSQSGQEEPGTENIPHLDLSTWKGKLLLALGIVAALTVVSVMIRALLPAAVIAVIIGIVISFLRKWPRQ